MPGYIYGIYQEEYDITFIMEETRDEQGDSVIALEVVGFYYGEPDDRLNREFYGSRKAIFT